MLAIACGSDPIASGPLEGQGGGSSAGGAGPASGGTGVTTSGGTTSGTSTSTSSSSSSGAGGGGVVCANGTGDCNGDASDGCETTLATDPSHCGACGVTCQAPATCSGGQCSSSCSPGTADCDNHSGNGCEINTWLDVSNCGGCGIVCPSGPAESPTCSAGICGISCTPPMGDCNGNASDGCEANLTTDPANCGECGQGCGGATCVQGACECAAESQTGQLVPLDLYIMLDQSGSMTSDVAGGQTAWQAVTTALESFFSNPANSSLGVGLQYFPLASGGGSCPSTCFTDVDCGACGPCFFVLFFGTCIGGGGCTVADYATPEVEIAPLTPAHAQALSTSLGAHSPSGGTPTAAALQGAVDHASVWAQQNPTHKVMVVLATDGDPTECSPTDPGQISSQIAAPAAAAGIKTFVIGVGSSLTALNTIAAGGGTGQAFLVDTGGNVVQQFEEALKAIQQTALGCEYLIPQPAQGQLDYDKVNVKYTPGNGGPAQLLGNVADQGACGANGGWYYDNPAAPTKIILCDATCTAVKADGTGAIDVLLGCATQHE